MFIQWKGKKRRVWLIVSSFFLFLVCLTGLFQFQLIKERTIIKNKQVAGVFDEKNDPGIPVGILIPEIDVRADIQSVGVNTKGEMDVPTNAYDVGWFSFGSRPGEVGSAVVAGHADTKNGQMGVFANLNMLTEGSIIYIEDDKGEMHIFIVREIRILAPGFAEEVFNKNDIPHLNLVTCDGVWNNNKMSYDKRLVVYADGILSD